jgi:cold shock CspA family protein
VITGTIRTIHLDKNFGFIKGEDQQDYFFHATGLLNAYFENLKLGLTVTFEGVKTAKGLRAEQITVT